MRCLPFLLLVACTPTADTAPDDGNAADTDTDTETDTDTDTDTEADTDTDTDTDPAFVANGPAAGVFFQVTDLDLGDNACAVNISDYSLNMMNSITISNVDPTARTFTEKATASENADVACAYETSGSFTCAPTAQSMDLASFGMDAVVSWGLTMAGTFAEGTYTLEGGDHTFTTQYAADLDWRFAMSCAGSQCTRAGNMAGVTFPCETRGLEGVANLDDPSIPR